MVKKGVFFTIDALIASLLILSALFIMPVFYSSQSTSSPSVFYSNDLINILSSLNLYEINNTAVTQLLTTNNITNLNRTLLEQIYRFSIDDNNGAASSLINLTIGTFIPATHDFGIWIEGFDDSIYTTGPYNYSQIISRRHLVSGFEKNRTVEGIAARALIENINARIKSEYSYFGGYEGDGNITKVIDLNNLGEVVSVFFEIDASSNITLRINGNNVGTYDTQGTDVIDEFYLNETYFQYFKEGKNNVSFEFMGPLKYIGGGFIRIRYVTSDIFASETSGYKKENFPGIDGIINLYSSFYIPGNLTSMNIQLNLNSSKELFLTVGNKTIYSDTPGSSRIILTDDYLNSQLDYSELGGKTIPIRLGLRNVSYYTMELRGTADSVLVTDVSGSMDDCGEYVNATMCDYDCCVDGFCPESYSCASETCSNEECGACQSYPETCQYDCLWFWGALDHVESCVAQTCSNEVCGDCGSWRSDNNYASFSGQSVMTNNISYDSQSCRSLLDIAKDADKEFINTVLSIEDNQVGLVSYSSSVIDTHELSSNNISLINEVNTYDVEAATCICCGVLEATDIIDAQSDENRTRAMLIMTDGEANGDCNIDPVPDYDNDGDTTHDPQDHAIQASCDAFNNHNIIVYTVGFGDLSVDAQDILQQMADCGDGEFRLANITDLAEIYTNIAENILNLSYVRQTVVSNQPGSTNTTLFPDSFIEFNYSGEERAPQYGRIPITVETATFGNNISEGTFFVPSNMIVDDAKITSYSGDEWTDRAFMESGTEWTNFYFLGDYNLGYSNLGDPYSVNIPLSLINTGNNKVRISTGPYPENSSGGSPYNKVIYKGSVDLSVNYSGVYASAEGCNWLIQFEDNTNGSLSIPASYSGQKQCTYTNTTDCLALSDAIDNSVCQLLSQLDLDENGKVLVKFGEEDLLIETLSIGEIPYLWGPNVFEVRVWR